MRACAKCGTEIPAERLEALPHTRTCVNCSNLKPIVGFMISAFSKGTASEIVLVDPDNEEQLRRAQRANRRSR